MQCHRNVKHLDARQINLLWNHVNQAKFHSTGLTLTGISLCTVSGLHSCACIWEICMNTDVFKNHFDWTILIIVWRDATQSSLFIIMQVHCTCFGCQPHPSSVVHKRVTIASGTGNIFCASTSRQRGQAGTSLSTTPIIRSTQNCNYSLRYCAATSLQRGQAGTSLSTTHIIRSTQNCNYSLR